ncbi:hypothetical protein Clacol_003402 [Clathrus columnatus]|uniref:Uncharacterized protein n=1 Tax=Clathrus columnatus TaxID=1419009 RepID=A0AAV5A4H4_9AGAM|nr:hypothetical protein Clacol_003402 [Clathrus columnatus]
MILSVPSSSGFGTHPNATSAEKARDASPGILSILEDHNVKDAVVEWYEGTVEKLAGPALMRVARETNPTYYVRRPFTAVLGMPIATKEEKDDTDVQGSVSFFSHENKTSTGKASTRVLAVSNNHVLRQDTTVDYQFQGALGEIRALIAANDAETTRLATEIDCLEAKPKSTDPDQAEEDEEALAIVKNELDKLKKNNITLQRSQYSMDRYFVDWAPKISVEVDDRAYTRDIGTFELDSLKFKDHFQGNVVDLVVLINADSSFPSNRMLRIQGVVTPELLASPDCYDENGYPIFIVGKDGNTTNLTLGRYSGLDAYLCDKSGKESIEVANYNYDKKSGNFSAKGDSGALIWTGDGRMLAILHSGMPRGLNSHVTFATPAWWVLEQLRVHYPYADFNRATF